MCCCETQPTVCAARLGLRGSLALFLDVLLKRLLVGPTPHANVPEMNQKIALLKNNEVKKLVYGSVIALSPVFNDDHHKKFIMTDGVINPKIHLQYFHALLGHSARSC